MNTTPSSGAPDDSIKVPIGPALAELLEIAFDAEVPVMLVGPTGIGKSEFVQALAERLGWQIEVINTALLEGPGELAGLPVIRDGKTVYATPDSLPRGGVGILLYEEFSRALPFVLAPTYEFMTRRRIGQYVLPPGWRIVVCCNPPGPDYDVLTFDKAMHERFLRLEVCADRIAWIAWAQINGVHPAILSMARDDGRMFELVPPRTWAHCSKLLHAADARGRSRRARQALLAAKLGSVESARAVMKYVDRKPQASLVRAEDVLARFDTDERLVERFRRLLAQGRTDLVEKLSYEVEAIVGGSRLAPLISNYGFRLEAFERFLQDVPGDRRQHLQRALARNPASAGVLDVDPATVFTRQGATLPALLRTWQRSGLSHRVGAFMHRVAGHLALLSDEDLAALQQLGARRGLGRLVAQAGAEDARPVTEMLRALDLELPEDG